MDRNIPGFFSTPILRKLIPASMNLSPPVGRLGSSHYQGCGGAWMCGLGCAHVHTCGPLKSHTGSGKRSGWAGAASSWASPSLHRMPVEPESAKFSDLWLPVVMKEHLSNRRTDGFYLCLAWFIIFKYTNRRHMTSIFLPWTPRMLGMRMC